MAKITAEYDTKEKTLSVSKDGKALDNVMHASFSRNYNYEKGTEDDTHSCQIAMKDSSSEEGYHTHTHIIANEDGDLETRTEKVPVAKATSDLIGQLLRR
jgi:hypothetical protein